jgi:hypothetical protein
MCLQECSCVPVLQLGVELVSFQIGFVELRPRAKQGMSFLTHSRTTILLPLLCIIPQEDLWDACGEAKMRLPGPQGGPEQQRARKPMGPGSTKPTVQKVSLSQGKIYCCSTSDFPTGGTFPPANLKLGDAGHISDSSGWHRKEPTADALAPQPSSPHCSGSALMSRCRFHWAFHTLVDFVALPCG